MEMPSRVPWDWWILASHWATAGGHARPLFSLASPWQIPATETKASGPTVLVLAGQEQRAPFRKRGNKGKQKRTI